MSLVAKWHIHDRQRSGRAKTLCGLLIHSPREYTIRSDARQWKKPVIVSPKKLWHARLMYKCNRCLNAAFGPGASTAYWLQSDERKEYEARGGPRGRLFSGHRLRMTTEEIQARLRALEARVGT